MKILVTGGAGFIGSHVVDKYIELGHDVIIIDDLSTGQKANINTKATFYQIDIRSPEIAKIFEKEKPDIVNHHAAQISVPISVKEPLLDLDINGKGFLNLLETCKKYPVKKVILISSGGAIYGEATEYPTTETYIPIPMSPYAIHKYISEIYLQYYATTFGLKYTILRYANVFGPRQISTSEAGVVSIFIQTLLAGKQPYLYAYPESPDGMIRDYVYVQDVVKANVLALETGNNETVNIGTSVETTTGELLREICRQMNVVYYPNCDKPRPGDIKRSCLVARKAKQILGWEPDYCLSKGITETIEFFKTGQ